MATKIYLPSGGAAPSGITPSFDGGWTTTGSAVRYPCHIAKQSTSITTINVNDASNAQRDILVGQWISRLLTAGQTITGAQAISIQARCAEVNAASNMFLTWKVFVVNGTTIQKTLIAKRADATEVNTSLQNRTDSATSTAGNYTTVTGDRIVIEIGLSGDPTSSNDHNSSISIGDNAASDLASNDTTTNADNPNVILNDTLTFYELVSLTDSMTLTDAPTKTVTKATTDTATLTDALSKANAKTFADSMLLSDAMVREITKGLSDTQNLSDANVKTIVKVVVDSATLTDQIAKTLSVQHADAMLLSDEVVKNINCFFADSFVLTEDLLKQFLLSLSDALVLTEVLQKGMFVFAEDDLVLSDQLEKLFGLNLFDAIVITEVPTVNLTGGGASNIEIEIEDELILTDSVEKHFTLSNADFIVLADNLTKQITILRNDAVLLQQRFKKLLFTEDMVFSMVAQVPVAIINLTQQQAEAIQLVEKQATHIKLSQLDAEPINVYSNPNVEYNLIDNRT